MPLFDTSSIFNPLRERVPGQVQRAFVPLRQQATFRQRAIGALGSPAQEQQFGVLDQAQAQAIADSLAQLDAQEAELQANLRAQEEARQFALSQQEQARKRSRRAGLFGLGSGLLGAGGSLLAASNPLAAAGLFAGSLGLGAAGAGR